MKQGSAAGNNFKIIFLALALFAGSLLIGTIATGTIAYADDDEDDDEDDDDDKKVTICHMKVITKVISENALDAHLDHGDYIGECVENEEEEIPIDIMRFDSGQNDNIFWVPLFFNHGLILGSPDNDNSEFRDASSCVALDGHITKFAYEIGPSNTPDVVVTAKLWLNHQEIGSCTVVTGSEAASCVINLEQPIIAVDLVAVSDQTDTEFIKVKSRHAFVHLGE